MERSCPINQAGTAEGAGERREVKRPCKREGYNGGGERSRKSGGGTELTSKPNAEVETELASKVLNETQGDGTFAPDKSDGNRGGRRGEKCPCEREDEDGGGDVRGRRGRSWSRNTEGGDGVRVETWKAGMELKSKRGRLGRSWCPVVE